MVLLTGQCRKPRGLPGSLFIWIMNLRHSKLTDWALGKITIGKQFSVLDVGCGGGRTIAKLAELASEGRVFGIDHSKASVTAARRTNARSISAGRVEIGIGTVSALPFPDALFDLVTAVETHYYWPDLVRDLGEVRRVLKPGGKVLIAAEAYRGQRTEALTGPAMKLLGGSYLSVA